MNIEQEILTLKQTVQRKDQALIMAKAGLNRAYKYIAHNENNLSHAGEDSEICVAIRTAQEHVEKGLIEPEYLGDKEN